MKAQREMQAQSTPSFACQRKGSVSNFKDKCECRHEPPDVGMKSVNVIILTVLTTSGRGRGRDRDRGRGRGQWP